MKEVTAVAYAAGVVLLLLTVASSTFAAWRHRDTHRLDILGVVGSLAAVVFLRRGPVAPYAAAVLRIAQPYFLLRLVRHFREVPRLLQLGSLAAIGIWTIFIVVASPDPPVSGWRSIVAAYIAALQVYAAIAFTREAKRTAGVTAKRLVFAAAGTWMFAGAFAVRGLSTWLPLVADVSGQVNQLLISGALACYFLAFNTPRRLRSSWQRVEQARYLSGTADHDPDERGGRAAEDLNRAVARSAGNVATLVALRAVPTANDLVVQAATDPSLVGLAITLRAGLVGRAIRTGQAMSGSPGDCEPEIAGRLVRLGTQVLVAPIATNANTWGVVLVVQRRGSLFPDDDLRLLAQLSRYAGTALDHAHLVAEARERERRVADRRLRDAEVRMSLMLDSIKDYAMFVLDDQGKVVAWHIGAEHVFGYASGEMTQELAAPLHQMTQVDFAARLDEARRFRLAQREGPCRRRDGSEFIGVTTIRPLESDEGDLPGFVAVTRDVTERRDLEARLRQSQKMEAVGQLAGGIAHDFNNLLTAILGNADWLKQGLAGDDTRLREIGEIEKAAERAAALTRQLLAFSQRKMLEPSVLNLSRLVADLLPMLRRLIAEQIDIVYEPAPEVKTVLGDRSQVEQVVVNLAVNARDAMPAGGRLLIRTAGAWLDEATAAGEVMAGPYVMLEVIDTGIGMDAATERRIFEPFFTTKEFGSGTGLGLSTVYGIVKQMGGVVRVQSEPQRGTTFRLYFPESHATETAPARHAPSAVPRGNETLLVVEDDDAVRAFLTRALEQGGYRIISAEHAAAALALAQAYIDRIDLVITDMILPGSTGLELVKALSQVHAKLPALYISGYADAVFTGQGTFPKASHFLQKPFSAEDLLKRIRQILTTR